MVFITVASNHLSSLFFSPILFFLTSLRDGYAVFRLNHFATDGNVFATKFVVLLTEMLVEVLLGLCMKEALPTS